MAALSADLMLGGCFPGDENQWASRRQIMEAAERCGVSELQPEKVGGAWTARVPDTVPDYQLREDCIHAELGNQGLLATR